MIILYLLSLLGLAIYSYSQIDLNLTLLQTPWFLSFQNSMIQLGYFQRPLSTTIFIILLFLLSSIFYLLSSAAKKGKLTNRQIFAVIIGVSVLGLLSYPAFSHDLFNSIFYPRIILDHQANPYQVTALMFPADTWTRFMQWTHNTYQWGPVYLLLTIPFYILGFHKFVLTLFWFKTMGVLAYLGTCFLVNKIARKPGLLLFALNPLIIIEGVVTGHLDLIMLFFAVLGVYLLIKKKPLLSVSSLIVSVGVKFATILLLPLVLVWGKITDRQKMVSLLTLAFLGALWQAVYREFLPHYFIVPFGLTSLYPENSLLQKIVLLLSVVMLLVRYIPFLYYGQWFTIRF